MITHSATLDVPTDTATLLTALLIAERRRRGTGIGARAATCRTQAILLLRPIVSRRTPPLVLRHTSSRRRAATSAPQNGVSRQSV